MPKASGSSARTHAATTRAQWSSSCSWSRRMSSRRHPSAFSNLSKASLLSLQGSYPGSNLVSSVFGVLGLLAVNRELLLQIAAFLAAASAQAGESALAVELAGAVRGDGVHVGQPSFRRGQLFARCGQGLAGVGGAAGEHPLVFGYLVAQLPVEGPGVASGGQGGIGLAGQRLGDHFGGLTLVGEDPSVVDGDELLGVPGVGGLAGAGLAGVSPVGVQGGAAQAGGRSPRCRLGLRRRYGPTNATGWESRPCGCPARSWPATPPPRRFGRHARSARSRSTRMTVAVVPLTSRLPDGPQRACSRTRSPAW